MDDAPRSSSMVEDLNSRLQLGDVIMAELVDRLAQAYELELPAQAAP